MPRLGKLLELVRARQVLKEAAVIQSCKNLAALEVEVAAARAARAAEVLLLPRDPNDN